MVHIANQGTAIVMRIAGDMNVTDVVALRNAIASALEDAAFEDGACVHCVVDVSAAHQLGPRGLALLVDEKALLMRRGGDLSLVTGGAALDPGVERLFRLHATVEEALAKLA
jgi:anti-anti-sigma factor